MVTVDQVADYLGVLPTEPNLPALLSAATTLVNEDLGRGLSRCPTEIHDLAVLTTADQLWRRRNSPGGISTWGPEGNTPIFLPKDVLTSARPLYARYRPLGRAA